MTDAFEPRSDFLRVMQERGFIHQCSDFAGLDDKARSGSLVAYIGFDCTAPSLHVGSLVQIMMLHWLQETGGKPVALMGGGTTMVGDPSGKDESRKLLTVAEIEANKAGIRKAFSHFIRFGDGKHDAIMPDNADWLAKLNYIDFLRDVGRHFSVNRMLAMDSVKLRLEPRAGALLPRIQLHVPAGLRFRRALQALRGDAADGRLRPVGQYRHRHRSRPAHGARAALRSDLAAHHHGVRRQDGQDRRRRGLARRDDARALTSTGSSGATPTTPTSAGSCRLFTLLPLDEIRRLESLAGAEINEAKKALANEATALLHGRAAAEAAAATARKTFEERELAESLPTVDVPGAEFEAGLGALSAFVRAGLVASTGEARRQIRGGGLRVNDATLGDEKALITREALKAGGIVKLSLGRKKHVLLRAV